ncbi:MAG TPA: S9 family peptidase [Agriterribacter sp.]|nr:S9 family peptidase [Agriterribacter sp.]
MKSFLLKVCLPAFLLMALVSLTAKGQYAGNLTLEDIYNSSKYNVAGFGPVRWMKDNKSYSTLERNEAVGGTDIVKYDARSGQRTVLVNARQLVPEGATQPLSIQHYTWSEDNRLLLIFTNTRKVWRYHTRGDYWVLHVATGALQQLGKSMEEATMMFAKFSPDATRVAFVSRNNIYVEQLVSGIITPVTSDGSDHIINGTFDWVYEEELDCRDGFRWSPDGTHIAYWQSDTKGTGVFYMINNIDSVYSQPIPLPYPKVGTGLSAVKVGVVAATGGATRWFDTPGDPRNNYIARMDFIPGSNEVMIQQLNRLQNTNRVWVADISSMQLKNILTDKDDAFLNLHDNIMWLDNEKAFTWTSEKDGWTKLYKVSRDGTKVEPIIKEQLDVVSISCIDPESGFVYYIASPHNYTQRFLYRSRLNGKGNAERVTPAGAGGQHSYQISADAKWAIHTYQSAGTPPQIALIQLQGHKTIRSLQENTVLKEAVLKLSLTPKEFVKIKTPEVEMDAWMIKPPGFDPSKKYPLMIYVYGEPAASTVQDSWQGGDLWHHFLAQQGYVVMSIDNRGTNVPRGREWRKSIYRQIGILAAKDQYAAARVILQQYPFIDAGRVGIWGWSGGGQMTLNCMFRYPDMYKTGIALAFVSDQRLYDATYQERYMGLPDDNAEGYREGSPITHAANLKGNLMIIHGTGDDNVHYQSFEMLADKLIQNNKLFSMMSYPMRSHSINERKNTSLHLRRTMFRFLKENL